MTLEEITYLWEPDGYVAGLTAATNHAALLDHLLAWRPLADDALTAAPAPSAFKTFRAGLLKERRGQYAGDGWAERYGAILIPYLMLRVSPIADRFGVPWGTAYIRLRDEGYITEEVDTAIWTAA
ncbi:MAG: hypothetical protein NUW01_04465 [Gemmatimonadaceae bacterium]|nr:hypothetical protein [Gemmatimonadaceae bacterium]